MAFQKGRFTLSKQWANTLLNKNNLDLATKKELMSLMDLEERISADFTLSEAEVDVRLKKVIGTFSQEDKANWEKKNWLEYRMIDEKKCYFKRSVSNLKLILASQQSKQKSSPGLVTTKFSLFLLEHSRKVITSGDSDGKPVEPINMKVTYRITVNADAVPDGETVRCWMPWPREIHNRQRDITLIKTSPTNHIIAPDSIEQRSIYLELTALKGKPTIFEIQYTYQSMAQYFELNKLKVFPYNKNAADFRQYTSEQYPQIIFSNKIKQLSDSIVGKAKDPVEKVRKLYYWINDHIIWTGALEYSIIPDIPGYVLLNRRGDCGMQTLLFMTMARYEGIPVKWQSGWMMHPGEVNLHDWCEVYYEGIGWVPLDMSFNLQNSNDIKEKEFYISGIDAYRMIVNDAISSRFVPTKKFPRSEPYDFQRGEVEWRGGNLYFNQWDYTIHVEYTK
ncbi:MAG: transglutaminase domain-containing protein [Bacteroidetes bacterium]|nr:transglutaminase domain-containing protein [Bacteroidota bacterium]